MKNGLRVDRPRVISARMVLGPDVETSPVVAAARLDLDYHLALILHAFAEVAIEGEMDVCCARLR